MSFKKPSQTNNLAKRNAIFPLSKGYTLIELMVTVTIVGILVAVAAPSLQESLRSNARESVMLDLTSSLGLARATAVSQGTITSICRSINQTACAASDGADWAAGWLVFSDSDGDGTLDNTDTILQARSALSAQVAIELADGSSSSISNDFVSFTNDGFLANLSSGAILKFCDPDNNSTNSRAIWISNTGRSSLSIDDGDGIHDDLAGDNLVCP